MVEMQRAKSWRGF